MEATPSPRQRAARLALRAASPLAVAIVCGAMQVPAGATTTYQAKIQAPLNQLVLNTGRQQDPLEIERHGCTGGACFDVALTASPAGLSLRHGEDLLPQGLAGDGLAMVSQYGNITIRRTPDSTSLATLVDVGLWLHVVGERQLTASAGAQASSSFSWSIAMSGSTMAQLWENEATNAAASTVNSNMWRIDDASLVASMKMRVDFGHLITISMTSIGNVQGEAGSSSSSFADYLLTLPTDRPVFSLPDGFTAWSDDWHIVDNHWCPNGCAPVPEPGSALLLAAGIAALPGFARWLRNPLNGERS